MFLFPDHPRPDKHTDRVAWNASWERDISEAYRLMSLSENPSLATWGDNPFRMGLLTDEVQMHLDQAIRFVCELQQTLAWFAIPKLAQDNFEKNWMALDDAKRHDFVLEGIYRTAVLGYDSEQWRQWTPELNVKRLSSGKGVRYIGLLKQLLLDDAEKSITEPIFVPHPIIDQMFKVEKEELERIPGLNTGRIMFLAQRTRVLSLAVLNTLLAFYGEEAVYRTLKIRHSSKSHSAAHGKMERRTVTKEVDDRLKARAKAIKLEGNKDARYFCWHCKKDQSQLKKDQKLMACGRCRGIGRTIFYCSRDCQVKDYKEGFPRPHKASCGKPISEFEKSENVVPPNDKAVGLPSPVIIDTASKYVTIDLEMLKLLLRSQ